MKTGELTNRLASTPLLAHTYELDHAPAERWMPIDTYSVVGGSGSLHHGSRSWCWSVLLSHLSLARRMHACMSCCRPLTTATAPAGTIEYVRFTLNTRGVLAVAPVCMHAPSIDMMSTLSMSRVIRSGKCYNSRIDTVHKSSRISFLFFTSSAKVSSSSA